MAVSKVFSLERLICFSITILLTLSVVAVIVVVSINFDTNVGLDNVKVRDGAVWNYQCEEQRCVKTRIVDTSENPMGLSQCRHHCSNVSSVNIWPLPTGSIQSDGTLRWAPVNMSNINFRSINIEENHEFWKINEQRFIQQIQSKIPKTAPLTGSTRAHRMYIDFYVHSDDLTLKMKVDESYTLACFLLNNDILCSIEAQTIFGARNGIESLEQLIIYDDVLDQVLIRHGVEINDAPKYSHRGISLDTSRNYYTIDAIKRLIDAMAMVKLNVFHWHITDSHSFPMVIKSHSYLHTYGAYSPEKIYSQEAIQDVISYAYYRGIHVIPELDAPAHVGEGWQFTNYTTCFAIQPWTQYCYEAPCGQFNPTEPGLYDVLEDIYGEMMEMFNNPEWFHMGGDEVKHQCWATSDSLNEWMLEQGWGLEPDDYMRLWNHFQTNALARLDRAAGDKKPSKIIMWTSTLTEDPYVDQYLNPERYIIQIWTTATDANIMNLLSKGYELIMSNYDVLYLDCGYESWIGLGNNWCSPYSGWHEIYRQDLKLMGGQYENQILGAEGVLWSEQADDQSLDGRIWPRGIALAERLWSDPDTSFRAAEPRILLQRERFVQNGLRSENIQPEWCIQNEGGCPDPASA